MKRSYFWTHKDEARWNPGLFRNFTRWRARDRAAKTFAVLIWRDRSVSFWTFVPTLGWAGSLDCQSFKTPVHVFENRLFFDGRCGGIAVSFAQVQVFGVETSR